MAAAVEVVAVETPITTQLTLVALVVLEQSSQ
jgi:hypothetical protein